MCIIILPPSIHTHMGNKLTLNEGAIIDSYVEGDSCYTIALKHNCHYSTIRNVLVRNNVKLRGLSDAVKSKRKTEISSEQKQIMEGLLLGDGSVLRRGRTSHFKLKSIQKEFVDYVKFLLPFQCNEYMAEACVRNIMGQDCNCSEAYTIESLVDVSLDEYRDCWYPNGEKIVPEDLVLSPLLCKYWFYSDGYSSYVNKNCVVVGLCTNCFTKKECSSLQKKLCKIGLDFNIAKKVNGYILQARKKDSVNGFFKYIGNSELECFRYKWKEHKGTRPCRGY